MDLIIFLFPLLFILWKTTDFRRPDLIVFFIYIIVTFSRLVFLYKNPEYYINKRYLFGSELREQILNTFFLTLLALYTYIIAFNVNKKRFKINKLTLNERKLKLTICLIRIFCLIIYLIFFKIYLSSGNIIQMVFDIRLGYVSNIYILKQAIILIFLINFFLINVINEVNLKDRYFKKLLSLQIFISFLFLIIGDRNLFIFLILSFFYINPIKFTFKKVIQLSSILILITSIAFFMKSARDSVFSGNEDIVIENQSFGIQQFFNTVNGQNIDNFVLLQNDFNSLDDFLFGQHFLYGTIGLIPRSIWENKPESITSGQWFRERYYPSTIGGKPITSFGEQYVNFGILGIFILSLLSGLLYKGLWNSYVSCKSQNSLPITIIFTGLIKVTSYGFIGANILFDFITLIVPLILINKYINDRFLFYRSA